MVKKERLKKARITEEYVNFVGDIMYPKKVFGPYGHQPEKNRFPVERMTTLGFLLNPLRRRTVLEKWSPLEIALFEASMTLFGKAFHRVQKYVSCVAAAFHTVVIAAVVATCSMPLFKSCYASFPGTDEDDQGGDRVLL